VANGSASAHDECTISGFVIFHYINKQEAVVPLENPDAAALTLVAFDNSPAREGSGDPQATNRNQCSRRYSER